MIEISELDLRQIANPGILGLGDNPALAVLAFAKIAAGLTALSYGIIAAPAVPIRVALVIGGMAVVLCWMSFLAAIGFPLANSRLS